MTSYSPTQAPAPDLRERRRRELTRLIAFATVDLFERNGFAATTIDDIAAAAGISRTTFFRHCATKEAAVLIDDAGADAELVAAAERTSRSGPLRQLETAWEKMTAVFDTDHEGRDLFLRVRRLMRDNPPLLAAGLERDARLTEHITAALANGPGMDSLDAHAVAESFVLGMRLTFDEWVRCADQTPSASPPVLNDVYKRVRAALVRANETTTR